MDQSFVNAFKEKDSATIIRKLHPLILSQIKNIKHDLRQDMYQEMVVSILEVFQSNISVSKSPKDYVFERKIVYETFRTI